MNDEKQEIVTGAEPDTARDNFIDDGAGLVGEEWVVFHRRLAGPKLAWVRRLLVANGVPFRLSGYSIHGHVIEVAKGFLEDAWAGLNTIIGEMHIASHSRIVWDDLDNDHPIFAEDIVHFQFEEGPVQGGLVLSSQQVNLPKYEYPIQMFDVQSTNLSALGTYVHNGNDIPNEIVIFARFKGGPYYRYYGEAVTQQVWADLKAEMEKKALGLPEASVGGLFHSAVKQYADVGLTQCDKLNEQDEWQPVPTADERKKNRKHKYPAKMPTPVQQEVEATPEPTIQEEAPPETKPLPSMTVTNNPLDVLSMLQAPPTLQDAGEQKGQETDDDF
jgi:hypothetical protein